MLRHILIAMPVEGRYVFYLTSTEDTVDYGETVDLVRRRFGSHPSEEVFQQWWPYKDQLNMFVAFNLTVDEYRRIMNGGLEIGFFADDDDYIPRIVSREKELVFTKKVVVSEKTLKRSSSLQVMSMPI